MSQITKTTTAPIDTTKVIKLLEELDRTNKWIEEDNARPLTIHEEYGEEQFESYYMREYRVELQQRLISALGYVVAEEEEVNLEELPF